MSIYKNGIDLGANVPSGLIAIWSGLIANIPSGYIICDGNSGTPNLLTKFIEGVATAATNPGTTGGSTSKTTVGHTHIHNAGSNLGTGTMSDNTHSTSTDTITDIRPLFYDVAYLMKT